MKQLFRITYDESDYTYQIVNDTPITHETIELTIMIDGETHTLSRDARKVWIDKEAHSTIDPGLIQAIGRTVSLRYRM